MTNWLLNCWRSPRLKLRAALLAAAIVAAVGLPRFALAACNDINPVEAASCEMDSAQYGFYEFLASTVWSSFTAAGRGEADSHAPLRKS